jgi:methyl-accepting chemotaxis protein
MFRTIRGQLLLMAIVTLAGLMLLGGVAIQAARRGAAQLAELNAQAVEPMILIQSVERKVKEVRFRMAGVALGQLPSVGSANHLKEVQASLPSEWARLLAMGTAQSLPAKERGLLAKIDKGMGPLAALMERLQQAYQDDQISTVKAILEDDWPLMHSGVVKPLEGFIPYFQGQTGLALEQASQAARRSMLIVITLGLSVLAGIGLAQSYLQFRITRQIRAAKETVGAIARFDLTQPIQPRGQDEIASLLRDLASMQTRLREVVSQARDSAANLMRQSDGLAGASDRVAAASRTQAESSGGMAASIHELSTAIAQMREHSSASRDLAQDSGDMSREGRQVIQDAAGEMVAIAEGARSASALVTELAELSTEISDIVKVIRDISDQTHLLALNAAIESAHAGAHGRGFSVVAEEVRKLAERTSTSTTEIAGIIARIQGGTSRAESSMKANVVRADKGEALAVQAGAAIEKIEARAGQVVRSVQEIQLALSEQTSAAQDVAKRVEAIAQLTEDNSSASQITSQNAEQVSHLARGLNALVADFKV